MKHSPRFLALVDEARARIQEMEADAFLDRVSAGEVLTLIDVREDHEWAVGHPRGARHLSRGTLERDVEASFPDLDTPLVLMCGGGYRSALSADSLRLMGYTRVWSLAGGWRAWRDVGGPVDEGSG